MRVDPINLYDYEARAQQVLLHDYWDFIAGGSKDELTARRNRTAVLVSDGHLAGSDLAADGSETRVVGVDVIGAAEHQNGMRRLTRSVDLHEDVAEFVESIAQQCGRDRRAAVAQCLERREVRVPIRPARLDEHRDHRSPATGTRRER